jgi:hypothetical protein
VKQRLESLQKQVESLQTETHLLDSQNHCSSSEDSTSAVSVKGSHNSPHERQPSPANLSKSYHSSPSIHPQRSQVPRRQTYRETYDGHNPGYYSGRPPSARGLNIPISSTAINDISLPQQMATESFNGHQQQQQNQEETSIHQQSSMDWSMPILPRHAWSPQGQPNPLLPSTSQFPQEINSSSYYNAMLSPTISEGRHSQSQGAAAGTFPLPASFPNQSYFPKKVQYCKYLVL